MAAGDYNEVGPGLSPGLGRAPLQPSTQQSYERIAVEREQAQMWAACIGILIGVVVLFAAVQISRHRRKIARAADAAVVAGLATGVRASRRVASRKEALIARVLARANETPPQQD